MQREVLASHVGARLRDLAAAGRRARSHLLRRGNHGRVRGGAGGDEGLGFAILIRSTSSHLFAVQQSPEEMFIVFDARSRKVCEVFMNILSFWLRWFFHQSVVAGKGLRGRVRKTV